jgi:hypothetical protein
VDVGNPLIRKTCVVSPQDVPQYVNVVAVRRIASIEDDHLEAGLRSANSTDAAIDRDEVFRGPSV